MPGATTWEQQLTIPIQTEWILDIHENVGQGSFGLLIRTFCKSPRKNYLKYFFRMT